MQKYLKCLDSSPENGTFDMFCTSDHGNISFQLGNIFYGFQLADSMVTLGEPRDGKVLEKEQFELMDTFSSSKHSWRAVVGFAGE